MTAERIGSMARVGHGVRIVCVLCLALLSAACGFRPMHATPDGQTGSRAAQNMALISIAVIEDREGQILRNHLLDEITPRGQSPRPIYRLNANLETVLGGTNLEADATATRSRFSSQVVYTLVDLRTDKVILSGNARSARTFNLDENVSSVFRTFTSRDDALDLTLKDVSREIATRIAAFFDAAR